MTKAREPTFPKFLELPFELQVCVWLEAISKPSINFCDGIFESAPGRTWYPKLQAIPRYKDDSAYLVHEKLAGISPSAARALSVAHGGRATLRLDGQMHWMAKEIDILCFGSLNHPYMAAFEPVWHPDAYREDSTTFQVPYRGAAIDYTQTQQVYSGFERVGIKQQGSCEDPEFSLFPCRCVGDVGIFGLPHAFVCPLQVAGFIDCFPDIKEFVIVYMSRAGTGGLWGRTVQTRCDNRE